MNIFKLLFFDLLGGIYRNKLFTIPIFTIPALVVIDIFRVTQVLDVQVSYADFVMRAYGGMKPYQPDSGDPFQFPILWMLVFLPLAFSLQVYPYKDLSGWGQQVIIRTRSRVSWWLSKCGWNVLACLIYHFVLLAILALGNLLLSGEWNMSANVAFLRLFYDVFNEASSITPIPLYVLLLPVILSVTLGFIQLTLSLFIKAIYSFTAIVTIMIGSAYISHQAAIGNLAMLVRGDFVVGHGLPLMQGFYILPVISLSCVIIGYSRFRRYDIIKIKEV